jgi:hypothetical protein
VDRSVCLQAGDFAAINRLAQYMARCPLSLARLIRITPEGQRIYQVDPLRCPQCGGAMKIIALIEARQEEVLRKILQHCGLWHDPPARAPPKPPTPSRPQGSVPQRDSGFVVEPDGEFLEHTRRQRIDQPELPWEP